MSCTSAYSSYFLHDLNYISNQPFLLELFLSWVSWRKKVVWVFPPMGIPDPRGPAELGRGISKTILRSIMINQGKMLNMIEKAKRAQANFKLNTKLRNVINFYGFFFTSIGVSVIYSKFVSSNSFFKGLWITASELVMFTQVNVCKAALLCRYCCI